MYQTNFWISEILDLGNSQNALLPLFQTNQKGNLMGIYITGDALSDSTATFGVGPKFLSLTWILDLTGSYEGGYVFRRKLLVHVEKIDLDYP